jgi:hypothetical protein
MSFDEKTVAVEPELTATLRNAEIVRFGVGVGRVAKGDIYGDRLNRFPDGRTVWTSRIKRGPNDKRLGKDVVLTHSGNLYKLEMKT